MLGNMMHIPLLVSSILAHAVENNPDQKITTALDDGGIHQYTYSEFGVRVCQLAQGLQREGVRAGDRIATLAWNTYHHLELYYAISGIGAICHTVNPRLTVEQIAFIINHAEDSLLFYDPHFTYIVDKVRALCPTVRTWVSLNEGLPRSPAEASYSDWLATDGKLSWPVFDENTASALCYTSGTTGHPKGALYSHRSTVLHAYASCHPDALAISAHDTVLPLVPMFHVNAWGLPYAALLSGSHLVLPGASLSGEAIHALCERTGATIAAGVPTVFQGLLDHLVAASGRLSSLRRIVIGGSACAPQMIEAFQHYGALVLHAWGMTEVSPLGSVCRLLPKHEKLTREQARTVLATQGRPLFGIQFKVVGGDGSSVTRGAGVGHLRIRGNWVIERYFGQTQTATFDGWFDTGDVAGLEEDGYLRITDRTKDVIKSGGEWISSIELENIALEDPAVEMAACVAIPHPRWGERPLIVVVGRKGQSPRPQDILARYEGRVARYARPEKVLLIDRMPLTATGKIQKTALRKLPEVEALGA